MRLRAPTALALTLASLLVAGLVAGGCASGGGKSAAGTSAPAPSSVGGAPSATAGPLAPATRGGSEITGDSAAAIGRLIDAHIEFLSSDDLGGRETGTVQSLITGQYVASAFRAAGLQPGGEQGWFQSYPMESNRVAVDQAHVALHEAAGGTTELKLFDDYLISGYGGEGFAVTAETVFAGYGLVDAEAKVDDYAGTY